MRHGWQIRRARQALALAAGLAAAVLRGTTYEPPDFDRLVAQAEQVVQGTVLEVTSLAQSWNGQPIIETQAKVAVSAVGVGEAPEVLTLSLLGGELNGEVMHVEAMPQLQVGEEVVLFVSGNGRNVCPIVGWEHGAFRVRRDSLGDGAHVERWNGEPLAALEQIPRPLEPRSGVRAAATGDALTPAAFLAAVREARERSRRDR